MVTNFLIAPEIRHPIRSRPRQSRPKSTTDLAATWLGKIPE
jgi:hypothetical protein